MIDRKLHVMTMDLTFTYLLIQLFGFVGFGIYATASFRKSRRDLFTQEGIGAIGMGIQTLLLGSWLAFATNTIHGLMVFCARNHPELRISRKILTSGICATMICSVLFWDNSLIFYICLIATLINFVARTLKNDTSLRLLSMLSCTLWVAFHLLLGSWAGLFFATVAMIGHINYFSKRLYLGRAQQEAPI